jgi:hypothetical protein
VKSEEQLKEILDRLDLRNNIHPFMRCLECNCILKEVTKEEIMELLQPNTRDFYDEFKKCEGCGKIYWEGSHFERMKKFVEALLL